MKIYRNYWWMLGAVVFFLLDRIVKMMFLEGIWGERILTDWLAWRLEFNEGLAFGLGSGFGLVLASVGIIVFGYFLLRYQRLWITTLVGQWGVGLVLAGGLSNLFDRLLYDGRVVDYIDLKYYSVFNLADVWIVVGLLILMMFLWREEKNVV